MCETILKLASNKDSYSPIIFTPIQAILTPQATRLYYIVNMFKLLESLSLPLYENLGLLGWRTLV